MKFIATTIIEFRSLPYGVFKAVDGRFSAIDGFTVLTDASKNNVRMILKYQGESSFIDSDEYFGNNGVNMLDTLREIGVKSSDLVSMSHSLEYPIEFCAEDLENY